MYNINYFISKVNQIREKVPDIALTSDVIVGFPNETDELFDVTIENIKKRKSIFLQSVSCFEKIVMFCS